MEGLTRLLAGIKTWIEAHALGVGSAGLAALLVGGGVGIAGLTSGGDDGASPSSTVTTGVEIDESTTTSADETGETSTTSTTAADLGDGSTFIAVRVDNAPEARPQIGLAQAAMLVETPVEGGMTRFTAFYGPEAAPQVVGPVRSLRPVDADLISPFASVVVSTGGRPFVLQAVGASGVTLAVPDSAPGFTILPRPEPHNVFVRVAEIESAIPPTAVDEPGFPRGDLPGGDPAESISLSLGTDIEWAFEGGSYARSQDGEPFQVYDEYEGDLSQYTADVLVVLSAAQRSAGYTDSNDVDVPTFDVIGSGEVRVFTGGQVVEGTWTRSAQADPFVFVTADGSEFGVPEGRVHVMVVPRELEVGY
jgi:hypothetical protein